MSEYHDIKEVRDMIQTAVARLTASTGTVLIEAVDGKHDRFRIQKVGSNNERACFEVRIHPKAWR